MKIRILFLLLFIYSVRCWATAPLCEKFFQFAESATQSQSLSVTLHSDWSTMSITCSHNQQKSEMRFCSWLVENSSMEFMGTNVTALESCLTGKAVNYSSFSYNNKTATFTVSEVPNVSKDIDVSVSYSYGNEISKPWLSVAVSRYDE